MALTDENGGMNTTMLVSPTGGYAGGSCNNGFGDGNDWWIILFLILLMGGNWNNGGYGGNSGGLYPWMNQSDQINNGFRDQMINENITEIRNGVNSLSNQICDGFSSVEQGANARQIANMNQAFGMQTAIMQGFNGVQSQFADCCCENRLGISDLKYTVATENCADRYEAAQNTRDIIDSQTRGTQAILDKLCQLELDGVKAQVDAKNDRIVDLQNQLNMATFRESQVAQNAFIAQGLSNEVDALYNRLNNCPVPTTPVYGRTPIFTCDNNTGCGCGNF